MKRLFAFLIAGVLLFAGTFACAAGGLTATLRAFKVAADAAGQHLVPIERALPGDIIEYQVTYTNHGAESVHDVLATLPVPQGGMHYVANSAAPAQVLASLDGKNFAPAPLTRTVVRDGREQVENVPVSEYRFLRWKLAVLPPGRSVSMTSRMRLDGASDNNNRS